MIFISQNYIMKKFLLVAVFIVLSFSAIAQNDVQISILTEEGIVTVSKNEEGKDMISVTTGYWNEIAAGTKYISGSLPFYPGRHFCFEIANKKQGICKKGIGFSCGIFECPAGFHRFPVIVNNENRLCSVTVCRSPGGTVKIIFNDKMDWQSLGNIE